MKLTTEAKFKIADQWYFRGNRSPLWFFVASLPDGSCQNGICEKVPHDWYPLLEEIAALRERLVRERDEWQLVPKQPTAEMIQAMENRQIEGAEQLSPTSIAYHLWREVYADLLAATPPSRNHVTTPQHPLGDSDECGAAKRRLQMKIGYSHGYLVTANDDGSVPLNSKILAKIDEAEPEFINRVINSVNQRDELLAALEGALAVGQIVGNSKRICNEAVAKAKP